MTREHPLPVSQQSTILHEIPETALHDLADDQTEIAPSPAVRAPVAGAANERSSPPVVDDRTREEAVPDFANSRPPPPAAPQSGSRRSAKADDATKPPWPPSGPSPRPKLAPRPAPLRTLTGLFAYTRGAPAWLVGLAGAVVAVAILGGGYAWLSRRDLPEPSELRKAYPYGYEGALGPRGERALGAAAVEFRFLEARPCAPGSFEDCLVYEYAWGGRAAGTMLLKKTEQGWVRASDDGMPFLLAR